MVWTAFIYHGTLNDLFSFAVETLRPLVKKFEAEEWIHGFNFNFYSGRGVHLSLRLDLVRKHQREIKKELRKLPFIPDPEECEEQDKIAEFYELGSKWAFLLHDQIDEKRFQREWIRDENFILAFHGLCNSLLFGYHDGIMIHLKAIGRIALTLGRFDEIKNDLVTINQKCTQWFIKPKADNQKS